MPNPLFINGVSNSSPAGLGTKAWTVDLTGVIAGTSLMVFAAFKCTGGSGVSIGVTDSVGSAYSFSGEEDATYTSGFNAVAGGSGTVTVTLHCDVSASGEVFDYVSLAVLQYDFLQDPQAPADGGINDVWGKGPIALVSLIGQGNLSLTGENSAWQPNTAYVSTSDSVQGLGFSQVKDNESPAVMQLVISPGTSGATEPAWNTSPGGLTFEGVSLIWENLVLIPSDGLLTFAMQGMDPFVEFPSPGTGWTLRTRSSGINAIAVFDQNGPWAGPFHSVLNKTTDTYDAVATMLPFYAEFNVLAPKRGFYGTFQGFTAPGFNGGTK